MYIYIHTYTHMFASELVFVFKHLQMNIDNNYI